MVGFSIPWFCDHHPRVKQHRETLAASLRMPDDASSMVTFGMTGPNRLIHSSLRGMKLVIARDDFVNLIAVFVIFEDDEMSDQFQEP